MELCKLLQLPVFHGAFIVAGKQGISREVQTVNMMDAPDIIHFLKENDLLITTAFHFKEDIDSLLSLILEMEKQGCSALGIKTKRFLDKIPEAAVSLANELQFPLIELPVQTSLGDIVNQSLSYILDVRTNELDQAMQTHQQFTNDVISGQGIEKIVKRLSTLIDYPVVLLNHQLRPLQKQAKQKSIIDRLEELLTKGYSFHLPKTTMSSFSMLSETRESISLFPIYTHKSQSSFLAVLGFIPLSDRSTILTVEQATNVIAFELMKENALNQHSRRVRNEYFSNFINRTFSSNDEIISRGREFGLQNDKRYICVAADISDQDKTVPTIQYQSKQELIYETIESEIRPFEQPVHIFTMDQSYILLFELVGTWKNIEETVLSLLKTIQSKVYTYYREHISFGISNYAEQLIQVPVSYKEAKDALYYGNMSGKIQFIEIYQPKEVPEILRMVPIDQLKKFYTDTFQAFANEPKKDHQDLLQTLSVYLETHCQLSETAKRLYIHRNTVIYRLEKCEEIIGRSIKEPDETLRLRLAFRIKTLLQGST
ncbi:PucR family transcriptional regulator [Bacillus sp. SA1-12]|uniref:PucR family transcriptional regulator n=1 Tax=Bacillus sp. SA1-12 TaxID=1455638 RepID=UPI000626FB38|nr:PucR family transcriptional regulator [Bacillus sp. SA1-12]KKI90437.1 PucR family transcriptional regulator [Bacillus sp. SA1-12]